MGDSQHFTFNLDQFQVDILGAFFDVCKICFQRKCITVRIDCSKEFSKESNCSVTFEVLFIYYYYLLLSLLGSLTCKYMTKKKAIYN